MDSTFKFYSQIIDKMIDEKTFWRYYFPSPYNMDYGQEIDRNTWFSCGATRGCIISNECDEVIKFTFEDGNECENELNTYAAAKREGLAFCFVPCRYIGTYERDVWVLENWDEAAEQTSFSSDPDEWDSVVEDEENVVRKHIYLPLYAYSKIDADDGDLYCDELSPEERNFCRNTESPLTERSYKVGTEFLREYGKDLFMKLSQFCHDWEVNDLHSGNVGYLNGHVVILDYAGYWR